MQLRAVVRGRMRQIASAGGAPVDVRLYGCRVVKQPHAKNGKTYAWLDWSGARGDLDALRAVDDFVRRHAASGFSPLRDGGVVVVKVPPDMRYEDAAADPCDPWPVEPGVLVDVELRPGAFGDFGYCWLLRRIKPGHGAAHDFSVRE